MTIESCVAVPQQINDATDAFDLYGLLAQTQLDRLWKTRRRGAALGRMGAVAAIERATSEIDPLARQFEKGTLPEPRALERAANALAWALRRNSADLGNADSRKLDRQQLRLINLLGDVEVEAKHRLDTLNSRHRPVAIDNPQATRMANARLVTEQCRYRAYRADFDFIWRHVQLVLTGKDPMTDRVIAGQSQLDCAVLSLARTGAPRVDPTYQMSREQPAVDAGTTVGVAKPSCSWARP